jgi:hypothetical protein
MIAGSSLLVPEAELRRVDDLDWSRVSADLDARGHAVLQGLLQEDECRALAALYPEDANFRSRITMARHGSAEVSTSTSSIHCRTPLPSCGQGSTAA